MPTTPKYKKTNKTHLCSDKKMRTLYTKDGKLYTKRKSPTTGKFRMVAVKASQKGGSRVNHKDRDVIVYPGETYEESVERHKASQKAIDKITNAIERQSESESLKKCGSTDYKFLDRYQLNEILKGKDRINGKSLPQCEKDERGVRYGNAKVNKECILDSHREMFGINHYQPKWIYPRDFEKTDKTQNGVFVGCVSKDLLQPYAIQRNNDDKIVEITPVEDTNDFQFIEAKTQAQVQREANAAAKSTNKVCRTISKNDFNNKGKACKTKAIVDETHNATDIKIGASSGLRYSQKMLSKCRAESIASASDTGEDLVDMCYSPSDLNSSINGSTPRLSAQSSAASLHQAKGGKQKRKTAKKPTKKPKTVKRTTKK